MARIGPLILGFTAILAVGGGWLCWRGPLTPAAKPDTASTNYVGSASCRQCHQGQFDLWAKSGHGCAERPVQMSIDGAAFQPPRSFKHGSQTSQARLEGEQCQIVTLGLHSNVEPHQVERVIGYEPLRQFLTPAPGGRWQVHEVAYAPKANEWFNVYGDEDRQPGEWGHWTGGGMNWNSRCASCHNTRLRKNYEEPTDSYRTVMAETAVGCEACHGPMQAHVQWRKSHPDAKQREPNPPLVNRSQTLDVCGSCHARREELTGDFQPGDSFFDHFSLEILDESERWYADGQVRDEDYEFASFMSSPMMASGVHCRDCHRADSGTGNALCMRCHSGKAPGFAKAPVINPAEHGHHKLSDKGGECIGCHMPVTVYMQRHPRHDHGFTSPDPLLTKQFAIPNACHGCHTEKSTDWALEYAERWYGKAMDRHNRERTRGIAAALRGDEQAKEHLVGMLSNSPEPAYWRAVAANLLWRWAAASRVKAALLAALKDGHPLVREQTVRALEGLAEAGDSEARAALEAVLADSGRNVRVAAAWALRASVDLQSRAGQELQHALAVNADQPRGQYRKAMFLLARQQPAEALLHLQKAIRQDPFSPPLRCEAAQVLDQLGRSAEALELLNQAEQLAPKDPQIAYLRAKVLFHNGRVQEAQAAAKRALEVQSDFQPAMDLLERLSKTQPTGAMPGRTASTQNQSGSR